MASCVRGNYQHMRWTTCQLISLTSGSHSFTNLLNPYMWSELVGACLLHPWVARLHQSAWPLHAKWASGCSSHPEADHSQTPPWANHTFSSSGCFILLDCLKNCGLVLSVPPLQPILTLKIVLTLTSIFHHRSLTSSIIKKRDSRLMKYSYGGTKSPLSVCTCTLTGSGVRCDLWGS